MDTRGARRIPEKRTQGGRGTSQRNGTRGTRPILDGISERPGGGVLQTRLESRHGRRRSRQRPLVRPGSFTHRKEGVRLCTTELRSRRSARPYRLLWGHRAPVRVTLDVGDDPGRTLTKRSTVPDQSLQAGVESHRDLGGCSVCPRPDPTVHPVAVLQTPHSLTPTNRPSGLPQHIVSDSDLFSLPPLRTGVQRTPEVRPGRVDDGPRVGRPRRAGGDLSARCTATSQPVVDVPNSGRRIGDPGDPVRSTQDDRHLGRTTRPVPRSNRPHRRRGGTDPVNTQKRFTFSYSTITN